MYHITKLCEKLYIFIFLHALCICTVVLLSEDQHFIFEATLDTLSKIVLRNLLPYIYIYVRLYVYLKGAKSFLNLNQFDIVIFQYGE